MAEKKLGKTSTGMQPEVEALLSYVLGIISGIVIFLIEKENKYVRFHALQSIFISIALMVIQTVLAITVVGVLLIPFVGLVGLVLWVLLMIKSWQGERFKVPMIGDWAEKSA
jgi:uncharacterized membrane protein